MNAELYKENIGTSYPSASLTMEVLSDGDAIVPDAKPDILKILCVTGHCYIEKTEVQKGRVLFTGQTEFTVLYCPESEDGIASLSASFPFNHIEENPSVTPEDIFFAESRTVHTECDLINSRKISLKSVIAIDFQSYTDLVISAAGSVRSPDAEVRTERIRATTVAASARETFTVSDEVSLPASQSAIRSPLQSRAAVTDRSVKLVSGKAVVKASLSLFRLYEAEDGSLCHAEYEIPFTQIVDVPNLREDMDCDIRLTLLSYSVTDVPDAGGEMRLSDISADIGLCILAFDTASYDIVSDVYVPGMKTSLSTAEVKKSVIVENRSDVLTVKESLDVPRDMPPMEQICPLYVSVASSEYTIRDGRLSLSGSVSVAVTYLSSEMCPVSCFTGEIPFSAAYDVPRGSLDAVIRCEVTHADYTFINPSKLDVRVNLDVTLTLRENNDRLPVINAVSVEECPEVFRPSITIYFVRSGDLLWDIAKRYGTTVQKILLANDMEEDAVLNVGMRLLIPA